MQSATSPIVEVVLRFEFFFWGTVKVVLQTNVFKIWCGLYNAMRFHSFNFFFINYISTILYFNCLNLLCFILIIVLCNCQVLSLTQLFAIPFFIYNCKNAEFANLIVKVRFFVALVPIFHRGSCIMLELNQKVCCISWAALQEIKWASCAALLAISKMFKKFLKGFKNFTGNFYLVFLLILTQI